LRLVLTNGRSAALLNDHLIVLGLTQINPQRRVMSDGYTRGTAIMPEHTAANRG
jgi:hypothetical protein